MGFCPGMFCGYKLLKGARLVLCFYWSCLLLRLKNFSFGVRIERLEFKDLRKMAYKVMVKVNAGLWFVVLFSLSSFCGLVGKFAFNDYDLGRLNTRR